MGRKAKSKEKIEVEEYDSPWSFTVTSASEPGAVHVVRLDAEPDQLCDCQHFQYRCAPSIRRGHSPRWVHCRHVKEVMAAVAWRAFYPAAQQSRESHGTEGEA